MKRCTFLLAILMSLALLVGCPQTKTEPTTAQTEPTTDTTAPTTESLTEPTHQLDGEPFAFTRENFPRMDGSTSMIPMGEAVAGVLLGESRDEVSDLVSFNRTTQSFRNLMYGDCDILLVSQPNAVVFDEMKENNFEVQLEPIANDALIFVVNENNPVDNLTTEQVRKIYSGEITNWSEVGGNNEPIMAFQRNEDAGSQALMTKLVMGDTPYAEAPKEHIIGSMGMLMEVVKDYDNSANAIGYSVYYYANDMKKAEGLKILSIDGVKPDAQTIRSGEYPHCNAYYCAIPANAEENSPNRIMFNWLLSEEGQYLLFREGYVSLMDFS